MQEEYSYLRNVYNEWYDKEFYELTGMQDVDLKILLELDIKNLTRYCSINKFAQKLCSDSNFWKLYFQKHNLPIYDIPTNTNGWLLEFNKMDIASRETNLILIINKIESKEGGSGLIHIIEKELNFLSNALYKITKNENLKNITYNKDPHLFIHYINNQYKFIISLKLNPKDINV